MDKEQFFYQGKFFDNSDDFLKYVEEWPNLPLDEANFDRIFDQLKKDVKLNIFDMYDVDITNGEMRALFEKVFLDIIDEVLIKR